MRGHEITRIVLEVVGVGVFIVLHFAVVLVYVLGSSLRGLPASLYWSIIGSGYAAMIALATLGPRRLGSIGARSRFDAWLLAFPAAVGATLLLVLVRLPFRFGGWDAHGMGASGAEANAVFLPWLHLALWLVIARTWRGTMHAELQADGSARNAG